MEKTLDFGGFSGKIWVKGEYVDFIELGYDYLIDVPEIDNQHKELANRLNNAIKHCTGKKKDEERFYFENTGKSINFLREHFKLEEKILSKTNYEDIEKHKSAHKKLLEDLIKMNDDIENKKVELNLFYVTAFIKENVMKHIKTYDLVAKKYFIEGNKM